MPAPSPSLPCEAGSGRAPTSAFGPVFPIPLVDPLSNFPRAGPPDISKGWVPPTLCARRPSSGRRRQPEALHELANADVFLAGLFHPLGVGAGQPVQHHANGRPKRVINRYSEAGRKFEAFRTPGSSTNHVMQQLAIVLCRHLAVPSSQPNRLQHTPPGTRAPLRTPLAAFRRMLGKPRPTLGCVRRNLSSERPHLGRLRPFSWLGSGPLSTKLGPTTFGQGSFRFGLRLAKFELGSTNAGLDQLWGCPRPHVGKEFDHILARGSRRTWLRIIGRSIASARRPTGQSTG